MVGELSKQSESNRGIQVLNISNVNANGKTVLNDGKLLELIQKYPFLYNPRVKAYNDTDYAVWAWKNINGAFNRSYANDPSAAFSTDDLINRWIILKPLIQCLSKAYDLEAIPQSLRKSVVKISSELENQSSNAVPKTNNIYRNLLLQSMWSISELPMEKKLDLERDVLEFILCSELESKQTTKLGDTAWNEIGNDTEEFLNEIGFKQVLLTSASHHERIFYSNNSNKKRITSYMKPRRSLGWIPLKEANYFVKPCRVNIKRSNIEDYLPLAQIMQMNNNKNRDIKESSSDRESPGIFGI